MNEDSGTMKVEKNIKKFPFSPENSHLLSLNKSIEMRSDMLSPSDRYKLLYKKQALLDEKMQKKKEEKEKEVCILFCFREEFFDDL